MLSFFSYPVPGYLDIPLVEHAPEHVVTGSLGDGVHGVLEVVVGGHGEVLEVHVVVGELKEGLGARLADHRVGVVGVAAFRQAVEVVCRRNKS